MKQGFVMLCTGVAFCSVVLGSVIIAVEALAEEKTTKTEYPLASSEELGAVLFRLHALEKSIPKFGTWCLFPGTIEGLAVTLEDGGFIGGSRDSNELDGSWTKWGACGWYSTSDTCFIPWYNLTHDGATMLMRMSDEEILDVIDVFAGE